MVGEELLSDDLVDKVRRASEHDSQVAQYGNNYQTLRGKEDVSRVRILSVGHEVVSIVSQIPLNNSAEH